MIILFRESEMGLYDIITINLFSKKILIYTLIYIYNFLRSFLNGGKCMHDYNHIIRDKNIVHFLLNIFSESQIAMYVY